MNTIKIFFVTNLLISLFILLPPDAFAALSCNTPMQCDQNFFGDNCDAACPQKRQAGQSCYCVLSTVMPLRIGGVTIFSPVYFTDIGSIISSLLPYIFIIAGLILFVLIINNGYKFLTSGGSPKNTESAKSGLTAALVGFVIIIAAYWLTQILEVILRINILGGP